MLKHFEHFGGCNKRFSTIGRKILALSKLASFKQKLKPVSKFEAIYLVKVADILPDMDNKLRGGK